MKFISLLVLFSLSGCDVTQISQNLGVKLSQDLGFTKPKVIISPATDMLISETEVASVVGYDQCPHEMKLLSNSCINLGTDINEVKVSMRVGDVHVNEVWKVTRQDDALTLTRPNGFVVRGL